MSLDVYLKMDIDTGGPEPYRVELFTYSVTHNLSNMASEACIYEHLWRPDEIGITHAEQLIEPLSAGLELMETEPVRFWKFNPDNGWGSYDGFVSFVSSYLDACRKHPLAKVSVWR